MYVITAPAHISSSGKNSLVDIGQHAIQTPCRSERLLQVSTKSNQIRLQTNSSSHMYNYNYNVISGACVHVL